MKGATRGKGVGEGGGGGNLEVEGSSFMGSSRRLTVPLCIHTVCCCLRCLLTHLAQASLPTHLHPSQHC